MPSRELRPHTTAASSRRRDASAPPLQCSLRAVRRSATAAARMSATHVALWGRFPAPRAQQRTRVSFSVAQHIIAAGRERELERRCLEKDGDFRYVDVEPHGVIEAAGPVGASATIIGSQLESRCASAAGVRWHQPPPGAHAVVLFSERDVPQVLDERSCQHARHGSSTTTKRLLCAFDAACADMIAIPPKHRQRNGIATCAIYKVFPLPKQHK